MMRASTKRIARGDYIAVLRDEKGTVMWECPHQHTERDMGPRSAYVCAATERNRREGQA